MMLNKTFHLILLSLIPIFGFSQANSQYPDSGIKIRLGFQTTGDGLIWRDTQPKVGGYQPINNKAAWIILDTANNKFYHYKNSAWTLAGGQDIDTANLIATKYNLGFKLSLADTQNMLTPYWRSGRFSGVLPVANGGTGSATQNFVDLTTTQSIGGEKIFTNSVITVSNSAGAGFANFGSANGRAQYQYNNFGGRLNGEYGWQFGRSANPGFLPDAYFIYNVRKNNVALSIDTNSNVGIGTNFTMPSERLHVVGNGLFTGSMSLGTPLTGGNGGTGLTTFGAAGNIPFASSTTALKTNSRFKITEVGAAPHLEIDGAFRLRNQSPFVFDNKNNRYYVSMTMFDTSTNLVFQNYNGSDILLMNGFTRRVGIRYNAQDSAQVTEALTVNGNARITGNISIGSATPTTSGTGITFPATHSASTNVNTLDDYEEGTWTPIYRGLGGSIGSTAYSVQRGRYTRIGRFVHASGEINLTNKGSWTSGVEIAGLPYSTTSTEFTFGFIVLGFVDFGADVKYCQFIGTGAANNQAYIDTVKDNLDREILFTSAINNNSSFAFSFIYTTSN